ncbi:uncharacterized protein METZ01_LOCUS323167, partial [marine metagenome]
LLSGTILTSEKTYSASGTGKEPQTARDYGTTIE